MGGGELYQDEGASQEGFMTGEIGFRVSLHGSNPEPLMSALGQKRTLDRRLLMSALTPKADIREHGWKLPE